MARICFFVRNTIIKLKKRTSNEKDSTFYLGSKYFYILQRKISHIWSYINVLFSPKILKHEWEIFIIDITIIFRIITSNLFLLSIIITGISVILVSFSTSKKQNSIVNYSIEKEHFRRKEFSKLNYSAIPPKKTISSKNYFDQIKKNKLKWKDQDLNKKNTNETIYIAFHEKDNAPVTAKITFFSEATKKKNKFIADKYKNHATKNLTKKNYNVAIKSIRKGLLANPEDAKLYELKGKIYYEKKEFHKSMDAFIKCLQYNNLNTIAHFYLGQIYYKKKLYINAANHYQYVLGKKPNSHTTRLNLAINLYKQKKYKRAIFHLKKIPINRKKYNKITYYLAKTYFQLNKALKGLDVLNQQLVFSPKESLLHEIKGEILCAMKKFPAAIHSLQLSLQKKPHKYKTHLLLGTAHYANGSYKKALASLIRAKQIYPLDPHLHYELGWIYNKVKKKKKAIKSFETSLSLKPDYKEATLALLPLYKSFRLLSNSFFVLQKTSDTIGIKPQHHDFHIRAGDFFLANKKYEEAQESYHKAIESQEDISLPYFKIAMIYEKMKKYRNAELAYQNLIKEIPSSYDAYRLLGLLYYKKMKLPKKAEIHLKKYVSLKPKSKESNEIYNILQKL